MAYLYRHIRLDKNEPFYIGVSLSNDEKYTRAYDKKGRTNFWKNIAKLGYEVDILFDNISIEDSFKKEKEFIKLYGRRDLKNGSLCNLTDGGEGICNFKHSKESLEKISKSSKGRTHNKGRKQTIETRKKRSDSLKGIKRSEESKQKYSKCKIGNKIWLGKHHTKESIEKISKKQKGISREYACRKIAEIDINGNIITKYNSIKEAVNQTKISLTGIRNVLTGVSKSICKRNFKYI